jgi:hypothetical protein
VDFGDYGILNSTIVEGIQEFTFVKTSIGTSTNFANTAGQATPTALEEINRSRVWIAIAGPQESTPQVG